MGESLARQIGTAFKRTKNRPPLSIPISYMEGNVPVYKIPQGATGLEIPKEWCYPRKRMRYGAYHRDSYP